ncbi:MAG: AMP-binding protein [Candidatus Xenobium sp.]
MTFQSTAVIDDRGNVLDYAQLKAAGIRLARAVGGRCLVFNMCDNSLGSLVGYAGFLANRIVPAMLRRNPGAENLRQLYARYSPRFVWTDKADLARYPDCTAIHEEFGYVLLRTPFASAVLLHEDLALLLTTSGSTGSPKFVRQSYANLKANTASIVEYLGLAPSDRAITTLPMHYTYGLSVLNTHLAVGATLLLTDKTMMQKEFWSFFKEHGATSFGGVPYTYEILKKLRFFNMDLPSLRTMTQAGGRLAPELHREFAQFAADTGRRFVVMYGQSEATARMSWLPPERSLEKCGSIGIAIPGGRFELIDSEAQVIDEPDKTGELVYYGDNVTLGYAECAEDLARGDERRGTLATGDLARRDEEGYYYIVGRKNRFLKIFGNRVGLDEVEHLLKDRFPHTDCACAGRDDQMHVFAPAGAPLEEMKRFLVEATGLYQASIYLCEVPKIPKNEAGKTLYAELEKYYR